MREDRPLTSFTIAVYEIEPQASDKPIHRVQNLARRPRLKSTIRRRIERDLEKPLPQGHVYSAHVWREDDHGGPYRLQRGVHFQVVHVQSHAKGFRVIPCKPTAQDGTNP